MDGFWPLAALFGSAFTSATLLPGSSEAALAAVQVSGAAPLGIAIAVATVGNTLGSLVNWAMGRFANHLRGSRWFPVSEAQLSSAERWGRRYGIWTLLLSWVPIVGDPLTVVAGLLRTPFLPSLILIAAAKLARYLVVAGVVSLF